MSPIITIIKTDNARIPSAPKQQIAQQILDGLAVATCMEHHTIP